MCFFVFLTSYAHLDPSRHRDERSERDERIDRPVRSDRAKRRATVSGIHSQESEDESTREQRRERESDSSRSRTKQKPRRLSRSPLGRAKRYRDEEVSSNTEFNKRNLKLVPDRSHTSHYVHPHHVLHHVTPDHPYPLYPNPTASTHEHDPVEMVGPGGHAPTHRRRSNSGGSGLPPLPPLQSALRPPGSHPSHIVSGQRRGWFNRRGDEFVNPTTVILEERTDKQYPSHLRYHPEVGKGYQDSYGNVIDTNGRITRRIG